MGYVHILSTQTWLLFSNTLYSVYRDVVAIETKDLLVVRASTQSTLVKLCTLGVMSNQSGLYIRTCCDKNDPVGLINQHDYKSAQFMASRPAVTR